MWTNYFQNPQQRLSQAFRSDFLGSLANQKISYELSEAIINNPEETLKILEIFLENTETKENGTENESSP